MHLFLNYYLPIMYFYYSFCRIIIRIFIKIIIISAEKKDKKVRLFILFKASLKFKGDPLQDEVEEASKTSL